jgi:predicted nucleic acid-binding Zn ribbon protein
MARGPEPIGDILAQLMARRGFARVQSSAAAEKAWREAAGELAAFTRIGAVRRGKLEVTVANSTVVQELTFRKSALLGTLAKLLPDQRIQDVRFRVGNVD